MTPAVTRAWSVAALLALAVSLSAVASAPASALAAASDLRSPGAAEVREGASADTAAADTVDVAAGRERLVPPGGPDVRAIRGGDVADLLDPRPLARFGGSGRPGRRATLARGGLPFAMTSVVGGARVEDRVTNGLDVLAARALDGGALVVPSGPDLSVLPVRTASTVDGPVDLLARGVGPHLCAVVAAPGRVPGPIPWARLALSRGDLDWTSIAIEFGRRYADGAAGVSWFLERDDVGGPVPGSPHTVDHLGGRTVFELVSGWRAEVAARRSSLDRSIAAGSSSIDREWIASEGSLLLSSGRSRFEIFHTQAWVGRADPGGGGRSVRTTADGLAAEVDVGRGPLESVSVEASWLTADGSLLVEKEEALRLSGLVSARFPWDDRSVLVAAGGDRLGGRLVPAGCVTLSGEGREAAWALSAEAGGRQPTAVERFAIPFDVPGPGGADAALAGNEGLGPSRAVVVAAGYERRDLLSGVGGAVELASIARAITIARDGSTTARPVNADDELTVAASLWAAIGDTAGAGARSTIDLLWAEDDGALVSLEPIPTGSVGATAWLHSQLFRDGFLSVRWQLSVRHEAGLARGPWERLVGDAWTSVDVAAVGEAGPVRVFVEVRDVLDAGDERVPGQPPAGRRFSMGFSSSFWN